MLYPLPTISLSCALLFARSASVIALSWSSFHGCRSCLLPTTTRNEGSGPRRSNTLCPALCSLWVRRLFVWRIILQDERVHQYKAALCSQRPRSPSRGTRARAAAHTPAARVSRCALGCAFLQRKTRRPTATSVWSTCMDRARGRSASPGERRSRGARPRARLARSLWRGGQALRASKRHAARAKEIETGDRDRIASDGSVQGSAQAAQGRHRPDQFSTTSRLRVV